MRRITLTLVAASFGLLIAGCSSSSSTTTPPTSTAPAATTPTTSAPASASAAAATGLSGTWAGTYSGAYQGTFTLNWTQSSSNLSGTIKLSAPATTLRIHGTVRGGTIQFGTVGSANITYSGSVSGTSMSGNYQVHGGGGSSGGPWSASKG